MAHGVGYHVQGGNYVCWNVGYMCITNLSLVAVLVVSKSYAVN